MLGGPSTVDRTRQDSGLGSWQVSLPVGAGQPHSVKGIEDSSLLITIVSFKKGPEKPLDVVQEASEESFSASDSPAY